MSFGLLCSLFLAPVSASGRQLLNTAQMETLSAGAADRQVQSDLLSILKPVGKIDAGMFRWFHGVGLSTKPVRAEFKGVCRRDEVTLWYAPTEHAAEPDEEAPLRAYGVEATPLFHIIDLPTSKEPEERVGEHRWGADCDGLDTDETSWFAAKDAYHAVQGALLFRTAVASVKTGQFKSSSCPNIFEAGKLTCEEVITAVGDISRISSVEPCTSPIGSICYVVELDGTESIETTRMTISGEGQSESLTIGRVLSISIEQYLIVT